MRPAFLYLLLATCVPTLEGLESPRLDQPIRSEFRIVDVRSLDPCDAGAAVAQIARKTGVPAGFENTSTCWLSAQIAGPSNNDEVLTGMSTRQALDHLMTRMPSYSWRDMDGVVVVRPKEAWGNRANVLNLPTKPFAATDMALDNVLHTMLRAVTPSAFIPHEDAPRPRPISRPVTVAFRGGTMLEAVNAVLRARRDVEWQLGYGAGWATIVVSTFDIYGGVAMAPVALPQSQP